MDRIKINSALISVFHKDGLDSIALKLKELGVKVYSTGGSQSYLENLGLDVTSVESVTGYPSVFGGRVKTLHPKIHGGILHRREEDIDIQEREDYEIPPIDLVVVDLYPFEETVASGASEEDIIEKIDIGGIALIRGAAKNFKDVVIIASKNQYKDLDAILDNGGESSLAERKKLAGKAFNVSSHYDSAIYGFFDDESLKISIDESKTLRYGENPHQEGKFFGNLEDLFEQKNGKELSYNNLIDLDAAVRLIDEFDGTTAIAILKHNNACGMATGASTVEAYEKALAGDPVSAFGGVIISNSNIDLATAEKMNMLFFEILAAPSYDDDALELLKSKKNRILLVRKETELPEQLYRSVLNGIIYQSADLVTDSKDMLSYPTKRQPTDAEVDAMLFASKICKHSKSNTIVFTNDNQLFSSGVGQTSRVDALKHAIEKAKSFGFDLKGAAMASDAFFPFPDCVEIASEEGIECVIQPGGSIKDQLSIDFCDEKNMCMVFTGTRHFKH